MSSPGCEQTCTSAATKSSQDQEEQDFFDCQEDQEPPGPGETPQDKTGTERRQDSRERETGAGQEEQGDKEEEDSDFKEVDSEFKDVDSEFKEDLDSELKENTDPVVEFDDDYLREVEKELTEEEKESRRQESLTLKEAGNTLFKAGDWREAERSYTEALTLCPVCFNKERSILFSNRAAARAHLELKDLAISDCSRAIDLNPEYLRALLRRAELYEQTDKLDEALDDYKKVLERDPGHVGARQASMRLPQQIHERNEKLKEEMMSKLKDLGNMILRPFGLSTSNFQVNQDEASGSYSVNFVQNPNNNNR